VARRKPAKPADVEAIADAWPCTCEHPKARHWRGGGDYPAVCLHGQINPTDPCTCTGYTPAAAAA
jgi:hypothetical protein